MPPLGGARIRLYGDAMQAAAERQAATWQGQPVTTLATSTQAVTLDVMLETVFGLIGEAGARQRDLLTQVVHAAARPHLLLSFLQQDLGPWSPWGRFLRLRARVTEALQDLIDARRGVADPGGDLLSVLLRATHEDGQPMSDAELHDELITVLVTGHETTAMALCWVVHELMAHPPVLARVLHELDGADGTPDAALPLLDAAIAETLRLHPVVPGIGRMVMAPFSLGPWTLQPGHVITCSTWLSHRDPAVWPDPGDFDPHRFLDQRPAPGTWYPFGGGNRRCLGEHFARYELRVVLAAWLRSWTFEPVGPPVRAVRRSITMGPSGGLTVRIRARDQ
jgi:cytochrome P450